MTYSSSQYLATMSHELRTPLHAIRGFTEVLIDEIDGPVNPAQKQSLERIYKVSEYLLELVNGMLELAKTGALQLEGKVEDCDVIEILNFCVDTISSLADQKKIALEKKIPPSHCLIKAFPLHIRAIFLNLLGNALKFTDTGKITITLEPRAHEVVISIEDTGIGIDTQDLSKLFIPFAKTSAPSDKEHTGLGLPISRQLVDIYGGNMEISSQKGQGSTFVVKFPLNNTSAFLDRQRFSESHGSPLRREG